VSPISGVDRGHTLTSSPPRVSGALWRTIYASSTVVALEHASRPSVRSSINRFTGIALGRFRVVLRVLARHCRSVYRSSDNPVSLHEMSVVLQWNLFNACLFPQEFGDEISGDDASPAILQASCALTPKFPDKRVCGDFFQPLPSFFSH
jgi:hypothetical protein